MSPRSPYGRACLALLAIMIATAPVISQVYTPAGFTKGRALRGGILVCVDESLLHGQVRNLKFRENKGVLAAKLSSGRREVVSLSAREVLELAQIVERDDDHCFEVSIDPVADSFVDYFGPELAETSVAASFLVLDSDFSKVLLGTFGVPTDLGVTTDPVEVTDELLAPSAPPNDFRPLLLTTPLPPAAGHTSRIDVGIGRTGLDVAVEVTPTAHIRTADRRLVAYHGPEINPARAPYQPMATTVSTHTSWFADAVPSLADGLRLARGYALVAGCLHDQRERCQLKLPEPLDDLDFEHELDLRRMASRLRDGLESSFQASRLRHEWRKRRLAIDATTLTQEERVRLVEQEVLFHFSSASTTQTLAHYSSTDRGYLLELLDDPATLPIELRATAAMSRFALGVWEGESAAVSLASILTALRQLGDDRTNPRWYQGLRLVEQLLPVLRARQFIAADDPAEQQLDERHRWPGVTRPMPTQMEAYFDYVEEELAREFVDYARQNTEAIEQQVEGLFAADGCPRADHRTTLDLLARLEESHLIDIAGSEWTRALSAAARIHCAAGLAAARHDWVDEADGRWRILTSYRQQFEELDMQMELERLQSCLAMLESPRPTCRS